MKNKSTLLLFILLTSLSSCVYSLFPIYTDDTLVFREELLGKWALGEDKEEYILFEAYSENEQEEKEKTEQAYSIEIRDGFTISSDEPIFVTIDGRKVYDEDSIRQKMLSAIEEEDEPDEENISDKLKSKIKKSDIKEYEGSITVFEETSYKMTVVQNGTEDKYITHLVEIGEDLFMDLYPIVEYTSSTFSENFFPVHTFLKVNIEEDKLDFTFFDLDKLNKLFESNLIRMRHENVEGSILITAQPEEIQKFLDKYSDDDSVFDSIDSYSRIDS